MLATRVPVVDDDTSYSAIKVRKSPEQTMGRDAVRFGVSRQQSGVFWSGVGTETYHIYRIMHDKSHNKSNVSSIK